MWPDPRMMTKVEMEHCAICTYGAPHVCPRQYSPFEIVEDRRGFVAYLRCKDREACVRRCGSVDWKAVEDSCHVR